MSSGVASDRVTDVAEAWASLSVSAAATDSVAAQVRGLAAGVLDAVGVIDEVDAAGCVRSVAATQRIAVARELSFAAGRLVQAASVAQVLATRLVEGEPVALSDHQRSTSKWLEHHHGLSYGQATTVVRAAKACADYPVVMAAFVAGDVALGHVNAIAGIVPPRFRGEQRGHAVAAVEGVQDELVDLAKGHGVGRFGEFCDHLRERIDPDGNPTRAAEPSRMWLSKTLNGRWDLKGDLSGDDGALLATILMDRMAKDRRAEKAAAKIAPEPDAPGGMAGADSAPCPSERRARALFDLARDGAGASAPGRVGVFLHVDVEHLGLGPRPSLAEVLIDHTAPHTEAALDVTVDTLWSLLADADVTPIFTRSGHTLSYGRTHRLPPGILRRILAHRDRRCRFPGCDRPAIVNEAHHPIHWNGDGPTDPCNLCGGCGFHHHDCHDRGLGISGDAEGELEFTEPDGTPYDPTPGYRRRRLEPPDAEPVDAEPPEPPEPSSDDPTSDAPDDSG